MSVAKGDVSGEDSEKPTAGEKEERSEVVSVTPLPSRDTAL